MFLLLSYINYRNMKCSDLKYIPLACALLLATACNNGKNKGNNPPIVMGDSSTIVTETDARYLQDMVQDIKPLPPEPVATDAPAAQPATRQAPETTVAVPAAKQAPVAPVVQGNGLAIPFKEITVTIPGIVAKGYRNQNPVKPNGASYQYVSGNINGSRITVANGTVTKVSQRYQTILQIKNDLGTLPLETLTNTTDWAPLQGRNNTYTIAGLTPASLEPADISQAILKKAITKAAARHRQSKQKTQQWMQSVSRIRNTPQKPLYVVLRSVIWKIDGKDKSGKMFSKQVRIDING